MNEISLEYNKNSIILFFTGERLSGKRYKTTFNRYETEKLVTEFKEHLRTIGKISKVIPEDKAYTEEISVYKNGVERLLDITRKDEKMELHLICYTGNDAEDNWIRIPPGKLVKLTNLMEGYIKNLDW